MALSLSNNTHRFGLSGRGITGAFVNKISICRLLVRALKLLSLKNRKPISLIAALWFVKSKEERRGEKRKLSTGIGGLCAKPIVHVTHRM